MQKATLALCLATALASTSAIGQSASTSGTAPAYMVGQSATQIMVSDYLDKTVYGPADQSIGEIKNLVIDQTTGQVTDVVLGVGGFLGMGEKDVAIPFKDLKVAMRGGKSWFAVGASKDELKNAPDFKARVVQNEPVAAPEVANSGQVAKPVPQAEQTAANAPLPGANSFTEAQARSRLEAAGYSAIGALSKDAQSIWRGPAMKDGKSVTVAVDYKGNLTDQ